MHCLLSAFLVSTLAIPDVVIGAVLSDRRFAGSCGGLNTSLTSGKLK